MRKFRMFGYNIQSDFDLLIDETEFQEADLRIIDTHSEVDLGLKGDEQWAYEFQDHEIHVLIRDVAQYVVRSNEILISPCRGLDYDALILYLTGVVFGTYLFLNGRFAIHGSAVLVNGEALILCGDSGAGKSSLAREFINHGFQIISDDVAVIDINDQVMVTSSYPKQKMWQDTADVNALDTKNARSITNRDNKFNIGVKSDYAEGRWPLKGIILLVAEHGVTKVDLFKVNPLQVVIDNTYLYEYIELFELKKEHFHFSAQLSKKVNVAGIKRPVEGFTTLEQMEKILELEM